MSEKQEQNSICCEDADIRLRNLKLWSKSQLGVNSLVVKPASEDASFRRYFRLWVNDKTYIVMDAPPNKENCEPFIDISDRLRQHNIHAPKIHAKDLKQGYLLLDDLGSTSYLTALESSTANRLYGDALETLLRMQKNVPAQDLPPYNHQQLQNEMELFTDWFLTKHLQLSLDKNDKVGLNSCFELLISSALAQPRVFVHRDYHSRNLMACKNSNPGVLDFQDAMHGPITYDLVSLLRDCYIKWPKNQIENWLRIYYQLLTEHNLITKPYEKFKTWFDWMGMQRHLKAIGIFSRLKYRDGKSSFLKDIPRTYSYIVEVCNHYPDLAIFSETMAKLHVHERVSQ